MRLPIPMAPPPPRARRHAKPSNPPNPPESREAPVAVDDPMPPCPEGYDADLWREACREVGYDVSAAECGGSSVFHLAHASAGAIIASATTRDQADLEHEMDRLGVPRSVPCPDGWNRWCFVGSTVPLCNHGCRLEEHLGASVERAAQVEGLPE